MNGPAKAATQVRPSLVETLHRLAQPGAGAPYGRHVTLDVWPDGRSPTGKRWLLLWTPLDGEGHPLAEGGSAGTVSSPWLEEVLKRAREESVGDA